MRKIIVILAVLFTFAVPIILFAQEDPIDRMDGRNNEVVHATLTVGAGGDPANPGAFVVVPGTPCTISARQAGTHNVLLACKWGFNTVGKIGNVEVSVPADHVMMLNGS